ncbi:hypothetical protein [Pseudoalteromonas lipolytica]|uniref:hypothetical protein n=1 Tax=Pseudoalteromonas lipolytica TaxID=570156 RepID=UPI00309BB2A8
MTPNMKNFIAKNIINKVVEAYHVTESDHPIKRMSESVGVKYRFDDGTIQTISKEDAKSAPKFTPIWKLD